MLRRQLQCTNGKSVIKDLMNRAARPTSVIPTIERETGDILIAYMFEDRMPFIIRLSMEQLVGVKMDFALEMSKLSH